jgi:hypothetical protein
MDHNRGKQIIKEFVRLLEQRSDIKVSLRFDISPQVYEISGTVHTLLYVKARSERPLRWGVRKLIVEKLRRQKLPWSVFLTYDLPNTGFLFYSNVVMDYVDRKIWPLAKDGDYKPSDIPTYSDKSITIHTIDELFKKLSAT